MKYWRFKAFDSSGRIHTGYVSSKGWKEAIVKILQKKNMQVFDLVSISQLEYIQIAKLRKIS